MMKKSLLVLGLVFSGGLFAGAKSLVMLNDQEVAQLLGVANYAAAMIGQQGNPLEFLHYSSLEQQKNEIKQVINKLLQNNILSLSNSLKEFLNRFLNDNLNPEQSENFVNGVIHLVNDNVSDMIDNGMQMFAQHLIETKPTLVRLILSAQVSNIDSMQNKQLVDKVCKILTNFAKEQAWSQMAQNFIEIFVTRDMPKHIWAGYINDFKHILNSKMPKSHLHRAFYFAHEILSNNESSSAKA